MRRVVILEHYEPIQISTGHSICRNSIKELELKDAAHTLLVIVTDVVLLRTDSILSSQKAHKLFFKQFCVEHGQINETSPRLNCGHWW
jgi:hypothetical protein